MKKFDKKDGVVFGIAFVISVLFVVAIYKNLGIYYAINDDTAMRNIVSGAFDGEPNSHIVYIQYVIGVLLSTLYNIEVGIDWYGLFMLGTMALSMACIGYKAYMVTTEKKQYGVFVCAVLLIVAVCFKEVFEFQWTVVAAFAGTAALFLLGLKKNKYRFDWEAVMIIVMSLISFSIRKKVFYMILPVMGIVVLGLYMFPLLQNGFKNIEKEKCKQVILPVAIIFALMFIIDGIDNFVYSSDPEWAEYKKFNSARSDIMDYGGFPDYGSNWALYEELGYTEADADALEQFGMMINVDAEVLERIAEYNKSLYSTNSFEEAVEQTVERAEKVALKGSMQVLHALLFGCVIFLLLKTITNRKYVIINLVFILYEIALFIYLSYGDRFPTRIAIVYDMYSIFACFTLLLAQMETREKCSILKECILIPVIAILLGTCYYQIDDSIGDKDNFDLFVREIKRINKYVESQGEIVTVTAPNTFTTKEEFTFYRDVQIINRFSTGGWTQTSPFLEHKKELLGIEGEFFLLNDHVEYMSQKPKSVEEICAYYSQYTKYPVTYEEIDDWGAVEIYRIYELVEEQ